MRSAAPKSWTASVSTSSRANDPENSPVGVPVERDAGEKPREEHDREEAIAADEPAEAGESAEAPISSAQVLMMTCAASRRVADLSSRSSSVRPRGGQSGQGRRIGRAMERGDVLERNQDVSLSSMCGTPF